MVFDEAQRLRLIDEVEAMPVDHRASAQDQSQGFDVVKRQILEPFEPWWIGQGRDALAGARRFAVRGGQCCVVVAPLAWGRPSASVPRKMPTVTPRTAICAPN